MARKFTSHTHPLTDAEIDRDNETVQVKYRVSMDIVAYAGSNEVLEFTRDLAQKNFERVYAVKVEPISESQPEIAEWKSNPRTYP